MTEQLTSVRKAAVDSGISNGGKVRKAIRRSTTSRAQEVPLRFEPDLSSAAHCTNVRFELLI